MDAESSGFKPDGENDLAPAAPRPPSVSGERPQFVTGLTCLACVALSMGVFLSDSDSWETLQRFGCYPSGAVWEGKYWALVTSTFVHADLIHLAFNVYWLWHLGRLLEVYLGAIPMILFYVGTAIVSSGVQLAVSGEMGIGASGVVYGMFGFMWANARFVPAFRQRLTMDTINLFIVWLGLCVVLTQLDVWSVGNAAHVSGLLCGVCLAALRRLPAWRYPAAAGIVVLCFASMLPLFWCPMSWEWCARQATSAYLAEDWPRATYYYERSLNRGADPRWAWMSLAQTYRVAGHMAEYERAIEVLRGIDPSAVAEVEERFTAASEPSTQES